VILRVTALRIGIPSRAALRGRNRSRDYFRGPFYIAFHSLFGMILGIHSERYPDRIDRIDFIFDGKRGSNATSRCIAIHELVRQSATPPYDLLMGTAVPGDDKEILPLQAADLLAGQYRMFCQYAPYDKMPAPLSVLNDHVPIYSVALNEEMLLPFISQVNMFTATKILRDVKVKALNEPEKE
jgi:hypothetical protein